jgi:hypothetical protein
VLLGIINRFEPHEIMKPAPHVRQLESSEPMGACWPGAPVELIWSRNLIASRYVNANHTTIGEIIEL